MRLVVRAGIKTRWLGRFMALFAFSAAVYLFVVAPGSSLWQRIKAWSGPVLNKICHSQAKPEQSQDELDEIGQDGTSRLQVHFINVGEGDSILIQCDGKAWLIDGGPYRRGRRNHDTVHQYLQAHGVSHLQAVVCSHEHQDHVGGLTKGLRCVQFDQVWALPPLGPKHDGYDYFAQLAAQRGVPFGAPKWGCAYKIGRATATFFAPVKVSTLGGDDYHHDINNSSMVMRLQYGKHSFLFSGDIEKEAEEAYVKKYGAALASTVLKVPHHGSSTSTTPEFLNAVSPTFAVISVNVNEARWKGWDDHPSEDVMNRLQAFNCQYKRTDIDGTVVFNSDGHSLVMETEK